MKGYIETHTLGWLKRVMVESVEEDSLERKSQIICQILAGIPIPLIIVKETGNRIFVAITKANYVEAINDFIDGKFNLSNNIVLEKFLDASYLNKSFKDFETELKDSILTELQVTVFVAHKLSKEEQEFIQSSSVYPEVGAKIPLTKKESVAINPQEQKPIVFNPVQEELDRLMEHPFFYKVSIPNLDADVLVQMLMVTPNGVDRDLSLKNIAEFKSKLTVESAKKFNDLNKVLDFLNHAFPKEKSPYLKKAHLPMIYLCAVEAVSMKMKVNDFYRVIDNFFASENPVYKQAGQSGTAGKSNVNTRIRIMLDYFKQNS